MEGNNLCISREQLKILLHLLAPLCIYWTAEEMSVSVIADITTNALCPGKSTCSQAIYINGLQQMVVGICKMVVIPVLGQLADEYGRKPLLLLIISTAIFPSGMLFLLNFYFEKLVGIQKVERITCYLHITFYVYLHDDCLRYYVALAIELVSIIWMKSSRCESFN